MCIRVKSYCGCQSLKSGCITIGIVCIVLASLDLVFGIVAVAVISLEDHQWILLGLCGLRAVMDILLIVFSGILLCGTRREKVKKMKPWVGVCIVYCACLALEAVAIVLIIVWMDKKYIGYPIVMLILLCGTLAYLIYAIIVVCSFIRETGSGSDEDKNKK